MSQEVSNSSEQGGSTDRKNNRLEKATLPMTNLVDWQFPLKSMSRAAHDFTQGESQSPKTMAMLARLLLQDFCLVGKDDPAPAVKAETDLLQRALVTRVPDKVQEAIKLAVKELGAEDFDRREAAQKSLETFLTNHGAAILPLFKQADLADPEVQRILNLLVDQRSQTLARTTEALQDRLDVWSRRIGTSVAMELATDYVKKTPEIPWSEDERRAEIKALKELASDAEQIRSLDRIANMTQKAILQARSEKLENIYILGTEGHKNQDDYKVLELLPNLRDFIANSDGEFGDQGLKYLSCLRRLDSIDLGHTKITDEGMKALKGPRTLKRVYLNDTKITDAGLDNLAGLKELKLLDLENTGITDAGLKKPSGLERLEELSLAGTRVTGSGLAELSVLKNLATLDLSKTKITNAALPNIAKLEGLRNLDLSNTAISDEKELIKTVKAIKGLTRLTVANTKLSKEGMAQLRADLLKWKPDFVLD